MMSWLGSQLLPFTLLLVALMLLRPLALRWLGARWQYSLWAGVPMLLLLSLLPVAKFGAGDGVIYRMQVSVSQLSDAMVNQPEFASGWALVWGGGMTMMLLYIIAQHWYLAKTLREASMIQPSPSELCDVATDVNGPAEKVRSLFCKQSPTLQGPFVTGFFGATVLLPHDFHQRFTPLQQQLILRHEQMHWQRGDLHCNYLALLVLTLFWFHPLSWFAYRAYRQDQELACDALVLQDASSEQKIAYGYALLSNAQQSTANLQLLSNHYGDKHMMKQRLKQLQQQHGFSKTAMTITLATLVAAALWLQQPVQAASETIVPTMRIEPRYPIKAVEQKIEGYVVAEFDIKPDGSVDNVKIIKAVPEQMFEKEAVRALQQWAYSPSAVGMKKANVRLDFMLDPVSSEVERIDVTPSK